MAMTREQFRDLTQRVSVYAARRPRRYRLKTALLAAVGYGFLLGAMGLCVVLLLGAGQSLTQPWFWSLVRREGRLLVLWLLLVLAAASLLFSLVRALFVRWHAPVGRRVRRAEAPELFSMIDEVAAASAAPRPHTVLLTWDFNASVVQRPRLGWLGPTRDFLLLGLPLMAALSPGQFKAVLAHEFAHLRGRHGRFGNWIYRLRAIWNQLLERLAGERRVFGLALGAFARWYVPRFQAYTYALARAHEFEADAWSARIAGRREAATALMTLWLQDCKLEEKFWQPLGARSRRERAAPAGAFAQMLARLRTPPDASEHQRWARAILARETDGVDTHPAPAERLAALGFPGAPGQLPEGWLTAAAPLANDGPSAARMLLGGRAAEFLAELETGWRVVTGPVWEHRFERAQALRTRLDVLDQSVARGAGEPTETQGWERTCLLLELAEDGAAAARETLTRFCTRWPEHAGGRFALAGLLLEADEPAGVEQMHGALRLDSRLAAEGSARLAGFLRRNGQPEAAALHQREALRQADVLDAAGLERQRLTAKDQLLPHGLPEADIMALREQLARHPRVHQAWLARKQVVHLPEHPCHVLVCRLRWPWHEFVTPSKLGRNLDELQESLSVAGRSDFFLLVVSNRNHKERRIRNLRAVAGAEIYTRPRRKRWWGKRPATAPTEPPPPGTAHLPFDDGSPPPLPTSSAPARPAAWATATVVAALVVSLPLGFIVYRIGHSVAWDDVRRLRQGARAQPSAVAKESAARRPIPAAPLSATAEDDRELALNWAKRTMLAGYGAAGRHDARWDAAARDFIGRCLPWWAGCRDAPAPGTLLPAADALLRLGCDDPLVLYLAGRVKFDSDPQSSEAGALFQRALTGHRAGAYPRAVARLAADAFVQDCVRRREGTGQRNFAKNLWVTWFKEALRDGSYTADEQPVLVAQFATGQAENLLGEYRAECWPAVAAAGDAAVAPWARLWFSGKRHLADGWAARGGGVSSTVSREGWKKFAASLALARRDLTASWAANPARPEAASVMIEVVMGEVRGGGEDERLWFDRAVAAQFDHHPAYSKMLWALRPRWGGSHRAMLEFGMQCANTRRYDTNVPFVLFRAVSSVSQELDDPSEFFRDPTAAPWLEQMFDGYEREPSRQAPHLRARYHGHHARAAFLAGRHKEAYELLQQVDFQFPIEVVETLDDGDTASAFLGRAAAFGGPGGPLALAGFKAADQGNDAEALRLLRGALAASAAEPRARRHLRSKLGALELEQQIANGKWVNFQPAAGSELAGWEAPLGAWRVEADGALLGRTGGSGLMLVSEARVGPDFEVCGEVEFVPGATGAVQAGVVFGNPDFGGLDWRSLRVRRIPGEGGFATIAQHWHDGPVRPVPLGDRNTFALQSWKGRLTAWINGQLVFRDELLEKGLVSASGARVGLGAYAPEGNVFSLRYRHVKLRRLTAPPPLISTPAVAAADGGAGH